MSFDPLAELARVLAAENAEPAAGDHAIRATHAIASPFEPDRVARIARIARIAHAPGAKPEDTGRDGRAALTEMGAPLSDARPSASSTAGNAGPRPSARRWARWKAPSASHWGC